MATHAMNEGYQYQEGANPTNPDLLLNDAPSPWRVPNGTNGHSASDEETIYPQDYQRSRTRALFQDFSPLWFTMCMNAGIISIIMHQYQYQFNGLYVLSTIGFMIDFVLFIVFTIIFWIRLAMFRRQAFMEIINDKQDLSLMACQQIAWMTLVAFVSLIVSEASWGGHAFMLVGYVMWWFGMAWALVNLFFVLLCMINRAHDQSDPDLPPHVLLAAVATATTASVGGLLSSFGHGISGRLAVPVIIMSFLFVGISIVTATIFYTLLLQQLLQKGFYPAPQITSMFIFVGPMGQSAAALQALGSAAQTYMRFSEYHKGTFLTSTAAQPLYIACILLALLLTGMSVVFLILAFCAVIQRAIQRQLSWNPSWNSIIFPIGTLTLSTLYLGIEMDSPFFRVITGILLVFMILMFFINLAFTLFQIAKGQILIVKEDPRMKQRLEQQREKRQE